MIINMRINKGQTPEKSIHGISGPGKNFGPIIHQSIIGYKSGKLKQSLFWPWRWKKSCTRFYLLTKTLLLTSVNVNRRFLVKFLRGSRVGRDVLKFCSQVALAPQPGDDELSWRGWLFPCVNLSLTKYTQTRHVLSKLYIFGVIDITI